MTDRTQGPVCGESNSHDIDPGTLARSRMPAPQRHSGHGATACMPQICLNALVFEETDLISFLHSVAQAKAAERHVKVNWRSYDESSVINAIYTVMPFFGKPGYVEVDTGDINQVLAEAATEAQHLEEQFALAMARGGQRVARFMKIQEEIRESALGTVQDAFHTAAQLNAEIQEETRRHLARMILIKAGATLTLKTAALLGGGLPGFLIGFGYDLSLNLIKNLDQGGDAMLIGVQSKSWDKIWKKGAKDLAKNMANIYKSEARDPQHKVSWLAKRVAEQEENLENMSAEQLRKYGKDARRLARAESALSNAKWGMRVMSGVKYGFFAWDVFNTAMTARDELREAGY
jgi:hypothetical protein